MYIRVEHLLCCCEFESQHWKTPKKPKNQYKAVTGRLIGRLREKRIGAGPGTVSYHCIVRGQG